MLEPAAGNLYLPSQAQPCDDTNRGYARNRTFPHPAPPPAELVRYRNMELSDKKPNQTALQRHLANLKIVSRLLGHELHAQQSAKVIQLSRDEVIEIQTSIDLYIEEASRRTVTTVAAEPTTTLVGSRN